MLLRCARTSSEGNAFALETKDGILLIEAGVTVPEVKQMINFEISKVKGLVVSHGHL
jgi:metal-dependent hydrolase (beta-lactamase superfamily II)